MNQCIPKTLLKPRGGLSREKLLEQEILLLAPGQQCDRCFYFMWSDEKDSNCRTLDFYPDPSSFYRLTFSGDEGTDVIWFKMHGAHVCFQIGFIYPPPCSQQSVPRSLTLLPVKEKHVCFNSNVQSFKVFLMFQHLVRLGSWVCFWPDLPHKFQRKQAAAIANSESATSKLKQFMKLFRSNRAPFSTSKFGKGLKEAKQRLLRALKQDPDHPILQMFMNGIARDVGCPDPSSFTASQAIRAIAIRAGSNHIKATECKDVRCGAWIDHAQAWDQCWHAECMVQLYTMWEAGENPWTGQSAPVGASGDGEDDRVYSIKKVRWQVWWLTNLW